MHERKQNLADKEKDLWAQRMEHESELADQREKMIQAIKDHDTRLRAEMDDQRAELNEMHIKERKDMLKKAEEKALIEKLDMEEQMAEVQDRLDRLLNLNPYIKNQMCIRAFEM